MERQHSIAIAQVCATLALMEATASIGITWVQGKDEYLQRAFAYKRVAEANLANAEREIWTHKAEKETWTH